MNDQNNKIVCFIKLIWDIQNFNTCILFIKLPTYSFIFNFYNNNNNNNNNNSNLHYYVLK